MSPVLVMRVMSMGTGAIGAVALARLGGAEVKGTYSVFTAGASLAGALLSLGVAHQILRYIRGAVEPTSMRSTFLVSVGVLVAPVGLISLALGPFWFAASAWLVGGLLYVVPAQAAILVLAVRGVVRSSLLALLQPIATTTAVLLFYTLGWLDAAGAVLAAIVGYLVPAMVAVPWMPSTGRRPSIGEVIAGVHRRGLAWQPARLLLFACMRGDTLFVFYRFGVSEAGVYSVALTMSEMGLFLARAYAADSLHKAWTSSQSMVLGGALKVAAAIAAASALLLAIVGLPAIVFLFGADFVDAYGYLLLLLPGGIAFALVQVFVANANISGLRSELLIAVGFGACVMTSAMLLASSTFGVSGVAMGSSAGYLAMLIVMYHTMGGSTKYVD
jgi:O-antigen/teichoic acid export membrane protein